MNASANMGLAGVVAGRTAISTVGKEGVGLTYRGYSIEYLADNASFEGVAWLLMHGDRIVDAGGDSLVLQECG